MKISEKRLKRIINESIAKVLKEDKSPEAQVDFLNNKAIRTDQRWEDWMPWDGFPELALLDYDGADYFVHKALDPNTLEPLKNDSGKWKYASKISKVTYLKLLRHYQEEEKGLDRYMPNPDGKTIGLGGNKVDKSWAFSHFDVCLNVANWLAKSSPHLEPGRDTYIDNDDNEVEMPGMNTSFNDNPSEVNGLIDAGDIVEWIRSNNYPYLKKNFIRSSDGHLSYEIRSYVQGRAWFNYLLTGRNQESEVVDGKETQLTPRNVPISKIDDGAMMATFDRITMLKVDNAYYEMIRIAGSEYAERMEAQYADQ